MSNELKEAVANVLAGKSDGIGRDFMPDILKLLEAKNTFDRLTEFKTDEIIKRGYKLTGYVVMNEQGERGIIELSAVRWLSKDAMWDLMHPQHSNRTPQQIVDDTIRKYSGSEAKSMNEETTDRFIVEALQEVRAALDANVSPLP